MDVDEVAQRLAAIRRHSTLPLAVGFGIKDADSARTVAAVADGVVVGSALVSVMAQTVADGGNSGQAIEAVARLLVEIRKGIDSAAS